MPPGVYQRRPFPERFWEKVDKNGPVPEHRPELGQCWVWTKSLSEGYGATGGGPDRRAHRASWIMANGPIPYGLCVLHHCDNRPCVNPDHLWLGTKTDNMADKVAKGRQSRGVGTGLAKLTEDAVAEIRRRFSGGGYLQRELAAEYGVSQTAISKIVRGARWR